jgi:hypothetical protein
MSSHPVAAPTDLSTSSHPVAAPTGLPTSSHRVVAPTGLSTSSHPEVALTGLTTSSHPVVDPRQRELPRGNALLVRKRLDPLHHLHVLRAHASTTEMGILLMAAK